MLHAWPRYASLAVLLLAACFGSPPSFAQVDAAAARDLLARGRAGLVTAIAADEDAPPRGGVPWRLSDGEAVSLESAPPNLPDGNLLIVASREDLGMRLAAALARSRNREVWLFIPGSAEERRSVYVVRSPDSPASATKENPRGADS